MRRFSIKALLSASLLLLLCACAGRLSTTPLPTAAGDAAPPVRQVSVPNGGTSAAFSPDGARIAFLSSSPHMPTDLWVMNVDGSAPRRLTTRGVEAFRWAPDGASLLARARRRGVAEIYRISPEGGEAIVPGLPSDAGIPIPSPDGSLFAFAATGEDRTLALWLGTADGERLEAVTEKVNIRNFFWHPDGRKILFEIGQTYGTGIWELDLTTMEMRTMVDGYIGTPELSSQAGRIAYPSPTAPGEFEVRTAALDGADVRQHPAPRLDGRELAWDPDGGGVYYLAQDLRAAVAPRTTPSAADRPAALHDQNAAPEAVERFGVTALWRLDLATGEERQVSPEGLHLIDFSLAPGGDKALVAGLLPESVTSEIFLVDLAGGKMERLAASRPSFWQPVPSHDSSRMALFSNEFGSDALLVADAGGTVQAVHPGMQGDVRFSWLPRSGGLVLFSGRTLFAFTDSGPIDFPNRKDHGGILYGDVSVQEDRILISSTPKFGETPGLYLLEAKGSKLVQTDLRYPPVAEIIPEVYLQPRWSFDGKRIAFTDSVDIWTMEAEGVGRKWITDYATSNMEGTGTPAVASHPVWSIGGDRICYTLMAYEGERILRQIWVAAADGATPRMLYSEEMTSAYQLNINERTSLPFFDPADKRVIFTGVEDGVPNLFAAEVESGRVQRLTEDGAIFPALLFEDDAIVYTSLAGNEETVWVMNSDGTGKRPFTLKAKEAEAEAAATDEGQPAGEKEMTAAAEEKGTAPPAGEQTGIDGK